MTNDKVDQSRYQRLVDGELPADEYRATLATLDDEPGGWRRCALGFLESQALASELSGVRRSIDLRNAQDFNAPTNTNKSGEVSTLLVIAASFLVAFCLGIAAPRFFPSAGQDHGSAGNLNLAGTRGATGSDQPGLQHQTLRPIGNVRLLMDGPAGEVTEADNVPVYDVGQDLENYLSDAGPVLGTELIEFLRQQGYDVQRQQQFYPAPLDDGRQIIVPLDGYQITPVSRRY